MLRTAALKVATKAVLLLGVGFCAGLYWLQLNGIVTVREDRARKYAKQQLKLLDINPDDANGLKKLKGKAVGALAQIVPSAGGLCAGVAVGLKFF